ncbi:type I phosphomannose isomerase catalytic subunit [Vibrio mediterranei]|uniref:type I phosphomannose isomerase catalytic subunit n=1 Tax=Vibrio mediterranei TaxID=689 RepID=UPI0023D8FF93|nr:type I phosphomannose isomerase catalytic subunit [Vibrio mediterranei]
MIYKLKKPIKNFFWGSRTALKELFDIPNPNNLPQAKVWMGAHPSASSVIEWDNRDVTLEATIFADLEYWPGKKGKFFSLPFFAANEPLSIQVHPSRQAAVNGFNRENKAKTPLDASERNYKDNNHKPELVYAITHYLAMNGFRDFEQTVTNFDALNLSNIRGILNCLK